jgi:protein-S-isoprenylcysteine O-methyltransferase Ste14
MKSPNPFHNIARKWQVRLDRWVVFDPSRWPGRERLSRTVAVAIIALFLGLRLYRFDLFPQHYADAQRFYGGFKSTAGQPLYSAAQIALLWGVKLAVWLIETAIYLGYIAAYAGRAKAVRIARGVMETAFPVLVAGLPVLIGCMPYTLPRWAPFGSSRHLYYYLAITALILVGGAINLIGLLTLRRAFTIMSEARELIVHGIFRYIRHPLYTGHFIMFLGSALLRLHPATVALYLFFCMGQVVRAKIEEAKLMQAFPQYADYRRRTGRFLPKCRRPGRPAAAPFDV